MVKRIPLSQGKFALVDDTDFDELNQYKWFAHKQIVNQWYAMRNTSRTLGKRKIIYMHRKIMKYNGKKDIDHINHDGLDNRRCNLRVCTRSQNAKNNKGHITNTSGLRGVCWIKRNNRWQASIIKNNKNIYLGYFTNKYEAGRAYDKKAIELFGEFAVLNFPGETK